MTRTDRAVFVIAATLPLWLVVEALTGVSRDMMARTFVVFLGLVIVIRRAEH